MKKLALLLALVMLVSMFAACAEDGGSKDTDAADTSAAPAGTDAPETTEAPADTEAPEDTTPPETEPPLDLPAQGDVPCNFDDALNLGADILQSEYFLEANAAQWILGDDNTPMSQPLTKELLEEYKYFAFTYECDYSEEAYQIGLVFKYLHTDETKTEFLCSNWYQYGPAGMTYQSSSFMTMGLYAPTGVIYVPTEQFLNHEAWQEGSVINQMGISSIEDTNTSAYMVITGAYLTK